MSTPSPQKTSKFDYLVNVSEAAFQSMVIATIESFLVVGRAGKAGRLTRQRETFGLLWGYETTTASRWRTSTPMPSAAARPSFPRTAWRRSIRLCRLTDRT